MIRCGNPKAQYNARRAEIDAAIKRVLDSGAYMMGKEVAAFEREFAAYLGARDAIGVGSGTEALHLALAACGIGAGDEVITVSHTAVATVAAIEMTGANPVLVDIDADTFTMHPESMRAAVTERTRAIVPVHLYGYAAEMDDIQRIASQYGLRVIEDCAQAAGATHKGRRVGTMGDMGCFSFYPTKNLGAIGDGGAVVTHDAALAEKARRIRQYGWSEKRTSLERGWNTRLDEIQAGILRVKLSHLDEDNDRRRTLAGLYHELLADCGLVLPRSQDGRAHVYHLYVVRSRKRDELRDWLAVKEIETGIHYPLPVHMHPAYQSRAPIDRSLAETQKAAATVLSLPMYPELSEAEVRVVGEAVQEFCRTPVRTP